MGVTLMLMTDGDTSKVDSALSDEVGLPPGLAAADKGVKLSGVINSALTIHALEPNGIHFTDVFDNFACMQLIELVCVIFMKHESYTAFRIRQDLALLILRSQPRKP